MSDKFTLGLLGYPLEHSFSPIIHSSALDALELNGEYRLYPVRPLPEGESDLESLIQRLRSNEIKGINVTIPHKQSVLPLLDEVSPDARAIGAVNTILFRGGKLVGENTDASGFLYDLDRNAHSHFGRLAQSGDKKSPMGTVLVLGAGGASRAVAYALSKAGWRVIIAARRIVQALSVEETLKKSISGSQFISISLDHQSVLDIQETDYLIVNATSVGMQPRIDENPWPDELSLPAGSYVYDLVYNPPMTALMKQAQQEGIPFSGGIGMLVEQAALAFELWTARKAPRDVMHNSVTQIFQE